MADPQTAEQIVKDRYPSAYIKFHQAVFQAGQTSPYIPAAWCVRKCHGGDVIGEGRSQNEAWVNASTTVLKDMPKPVGLRIHRDMLTDNPRLGLPNVIREMIDETIADGEIVVVSEPDGTESRLESDGNGNYVIKPTI